MGMVGFSPCNFWKPPSQFFLINDFCWCIFFLVFLISYPTTVSKYHDTLLHHWIEMLGFDKGGNWSILIFIKPLHYNLLRAPGCKQSQIYSLLFRQAVASMFSPQVISTSPKTLFEFPQNSTSPPGKLRTKITSPRAKSTSPRPSDTPFFVPRCLFLYSLLSITLGKFFDFEFQSRLLFIISLLLKNFLTAVSESCTK